MSAKYLLDTNICIYIRQHRPVKVLARFRRLKPGDAVLSTITYGELIYGVQKSQNKNKALQQLAELTQLLPVAALPEESAQVYGETRATLEMQGQMIGNNDLWIAAHAQASNLILVTNNEREFKRISGLKVQNWAT
jgi:tRNA(fMet)-specific endonuclease VapC